MQIGTQIGTKSMISVFYGKSQNTTVNKYPWCYKWKSQNTTISEYYATVLLEILFQYLMMKQYGSWKRWVLNTLFLKKVINDPYF